MLFRQLGRSGLRVSVVSLGSWLNFGAAVDVAAARALVQQARELGINLFDTADVYRQGEGERVLAEAIDGLPRHHLVLASKCFFPMSQDVNDRGLSRKHVVESLHGSLRRLRSDYLDLYQCHRFDPETPLLETARAMDDLIRQGKVLYWGTSQWPAARIAEVVELCQRHGLHAPIGNQPLYNLFERGIETDVVPTSQQHGVGQIVFSPLAQGVLAGKYRPGEPPPAGSRATDARSNQFLDRYLTASHLERAQRLVAIARAHGLSATQMALAFCLRLGNVASVIVGARSPAQLAENAAAANVTLTPALVTELEAVFPA